MAISAKHERTRKPGGGGRTRIMVDVSPELRRRIKLAAAQRDLSVREYVTHILDEAVPSAPAEQEQPHRQMTREDAERLFTMSAAIRQAHPDVVFEDSTEIVRRMREERSDYLGRL